MLYVAPSSAPTNIVVSNITSMEFSIEWGPPSLADQNGVIRGYSIALTEKISATTTSFSVAGNVTLFDFQDLHPAYTYALEIAAVTVSPGPYSEVMLVKMADDG